MRNILLFVILISCTALCFAKNLEFKTLGLVGDEPLQSMVELPDGSILIAAEHGLFKSTDKGQTWDLLEFAQKDTSIYKLKLLKNGSVLASTDSGLFRSDDFGLTWKEIVFNSKNINNYFHNYKKNILYSILDSSIYLSSDNGDNWNLFLKKESLPNKTWDFIETDNGDFFCVSYGLDYKYHLMVSKDKGLTWNEIYYEKNEYDDEISGFIYLNGDTIFGKSDHGYLYSSIYLINLEKDSVNIFYKDIYYFIYDITKDTAGNFYYATRLGLYKHDIINNSVELIFQKTYLNDCLENVSIIKDVLINSKNEIYAVHAMGAYISQNGKDFESIFPASFNFWNNVYISKEYNIQELKNGEFMLISYGNFISSYYGRKYWKIVNTGIRPTRVWSGTPQHFISDNNGKIYIFIDSVGLYTSTDFGITWQRTDSLTFNDILVFSSVVDSANRLLVGTSTGLFISSDEGRYWFNLPFLTSKSITKMLQISNDTIIAVVGKNELYISEDKGNSWELFKNRLNTIDSITGIGINSKKEIFVSTYGSGIYKYSNNKWIQSNRGLNYLYVDRMLITQKDEILINIEETLNYSNKGGDYWVDISDDLYKILLQTKDGKIYFKYYYFICYVDSIPENTMATPGWIDKGDYLEQKVKIYNTKFLKYSKDGKNVYTFCGYPYHIYKWDVETGEMIEDKIFLYYNIMDLYDEDKFKVLMSNGNSNYADTTFLINFYENDLDSIVNQINISLGKIYSVENVYAFLLPNNKLITSFNSDSFNQISLWDLNSGENIKYIDLPYKFIIKKIETDLLVIKSVTRGYNNQNIDTFHILITDFNLSEIKEIYSEPFKRGSYEPDVTDFDAVKNTNKNSLLLSVNNNELIEIDLNSYEQIGTIKTKEICSKSQPISIILSDDSKYLISNVKDLNEDYYIKFFNLGTRKVDYSYHFSESTVNMALSPNSNDIAEGGSNGLLRILKPRVFNSEFNANFTSDSTFVIENEPLQFYDISNGNPIWWVWDFGDGTGSDEKNPIHTYRKSGEFNVKLIAYDGNKIDSVIKENYVTVKSQLIANYIASPRIGYIPLYVQFIDKSVGEDYKKRWLLFDGGIYETYDPKILFDEPGVFEVSLTVYNNYFSDTHIDSVIVLDTVSSIIDLNNEFSASTLPNPATDFVIVSFSVKQLSFVSVSLTDIIGNTVNYLENEFIESSCHIKKLDVSNLENGIYFLRISGNGINKVSKIIVCR